MEVIAIILGAILLATGMWSIDATKSEKHFTYPNVLTGERELPRYKLECRDPKGVLLFTVEGFHTAEAAQESADNFNATSGTKNVWTVVPLRYN